MSCCTHDLEDTPTIVFDKSNKEVIIVSERNEGIHFDNNIIKHDERNFENFRNELTIDCDHDTSNNNCHNKFEGRYLLSDLSEYMTNNVGDEGASLYKTHVPMPVHILISVKEAENILKIVSEEKIRDIAFGDIIRIAHPYYSYNYTIQSIDGCTIYLERVFNHLPVLRRKLDDRNKNLSRLFNPYATKRSGGISTRNNQIIPLEESCVLTSDSVKIINNLTMENISYRNPLSFIQAKIWKLVPRDHDKRLMWRRAYDDGLVNWYRDFDEHSGTFHHLKVNLKLCELEMLCFDSLLDPDQSIHQQRVHYFEKVPLGDIISETYKTVCDWHPKSLNIDIFKWAKLARSMKFLSSIRNSNHEVDMAFFRHHNQRKLNFTEFSSVLLDMATLKYPPPRYNEVESLSQLLWTSVVNLPQVSKMVWTHAKHFAITEELKRMTSQIRISAFYRMRTYKSSFASKREAATIISKWIRMYFAVMIAGKALNFAKLDWIYRARYRSAIICQRNLRMYLTRLSFQRYKINKRLSFENSVCLRWNRIVSMSLEKWFLIMYMESVNIQSFSASVSMTLSNHVHQDEDQILTIRVLLLSTNCWFKFNLSKLDIKQCLEAVFLENGPLSSEKLLLEDNLRSLTRRLCIDSKCLTPTVSLLKTGVIEEGDLVVNEWAAIQGRSYVLSAFRSHEHLVLHLFDQQLQERIRILFLFTELSDWLDECYDTQNKKPMKALKIWSLSLLRRLIRANVEDSTLINFPARQSDLNQDHDLLSIGNEEKLVRWLSSRLKITRILGYSEAILEYEVIFDQIEVAVIKCQSWWRSIIAQKVARNEVHLQYEKYFDRNEHRFFYIHTRARFVKRTKPCLLSDGDDIANPPDEWRVVNTTQETETRTFYFNPFTGQSSWLSETDAASMVQRVFRRRQEKILLTSHLTFKQVVDAMGFVRDIETKYAANPNKLSHIVNYALLNHFVHLNFSKAKSLYHEAISKSLHHPVIARAYGIFILLMCDPPFLKTFEKATRLFQEASAADPTAEKFKIAKENFIILSVLLNLNKPLALLNYALLHQCVLGEYYLAEKIYRRALAQEPNHQGIVENYNMFIDQRYPGGVYEGNGVPYVIFRRSEIVEERFEWGEYKLMRDPLTHRLEYNTFWLNTVDYSTSFEEPNWKNVWVDRVRRSTITCRLKLWIEYYDSGMMRTFVYNKATNEYVWKS